MTLVVFKKENIMKAKRIVILWGILSLSLSALAFSACGGSSQQTVEPAPAVVDCTAEGFCEAGHECSVNAECGSKKCELTVGLCIESCNAGFTFWTANGSEAGTC